MINSNVFKLMETALPKKIYNLYYLFSTFSLILYSEVLLLFYILFSCPVMAQEFSTDPASTDVQHLPILKVGEKVPAEFWEIKHILYENGETRKITLKEFKGKLLILDFWSTTCSICLKHQKEISYFKEKYKKELAVVMVNPLKSYDNLSILRQKIEEPFFKSFGITKSNFTSIVEDKYLQELFPSKGFPQYVWINSAGYVQIITFRNLLDRNYSSPYID